MAAVASVAAASLAFRVIDRLGGTWSPGCLPPAVLRQSRASSGSRATGCSCCTAPTSPVAPGSGGGLRSGTSGRPRAGGMGARARDWRFFGLTISWSRSDPRDHHRLGRLRVQQAARRLVPLPADRRGVPLGAIRWPGAVRPGCEAETHASAERHAGLHLSVLGYGVAQPAVPAQDRALAAGSSPIT